ncbi:FtsB family cell division protein [Microbacterium amylolyticum]|uniref:Cell division protein FtsB n=1 Tax=Microbacterium amylolyticum TaxID=936337 RepID=A0ABS4ZKG6_9MICO|nr:septum formation initiator family protein [Microbacterium amylolyticum]MBP2437702.1 cell division protein FtsB [Microbacterium amylolyticum]
MAKPAAPSSRSRKAAGSARVDVRDWLGSVRLSGFAVIMLGLVVLGAFVLVPSVGHYVDMRQQIDRAEASVTVTQAEIAELERERERWNDPAYIQTQARERLYFTQPGEVTYLIQNDIDVDDVVLGSGPVSADLVERDSDWMGTVLRSVVESGLAQHAVAETSPEDGEDDVFAPSPTPDDNE